MPVDTNTSDVRDKLKPVERRIKTLDEHIERADIYFKYKPIYQEYEAITKAKKKQEFTYTHDFEIRAFQSAKSYIDGVMNCKRSIPRKSWQAEREQLTAEKDLLYREYYKLKDEVREVEQIKRNVSEIIRAEIPREQKQKRKSYDMEI